MQLISVSAYIKRNFYLYCLLPLAGFLFIFLIFEIVTAFESKKLNDYETIKSFEQPIINSLISFQPELTSQLLKSITIANQWDYAFLITNENKTISEFPKQTSTSIGKTPNLKCSNSESLKYNEQIISRLCYQENIFKIINKPILGIITATLIFALIISIFIFLFIRNVEYIFHKIRSALHSTSPELHQYRFQEEKSIITILNEHRDLLDKNIKIEIEKEKALSKYKLASQVSHDIKSPLSVLQSLREKVGLLDSDESKQFLMSVDRLKNIADDLLADYKKSSPSAIDIISTINEVLNEKKIEFKNRDICYSIKSELDDIILSIDKFKFQRVLSNIINNSIESLNKNTKNVSIEISSQEDFIEISIADNGVGIDAQTLIILNSGMNASTSKQSGHGIGFNYSKHAIQEIGGALTIESVLHIGTKVRIKLPKNLKSLYQKLEIPKILVLIDDDELVALNWMSKCKKHSITFHHFKDLSSFDNIKDTISKDSSIFFDLNLSPSEDSIEYAKKLYEIGYKNLFVTTGYEKDTIAKPNYIIKIYDKKFPF